MRPVIGLSTYLEPMRWEIYDTRAAYLPEHYVTPLTSSGATVALLPPQPAEGAAAAIAALDGLVVTGGADVDPARYGAERHPMTQRARPDRDAWELALLDAAIASGTPFLAICRGVQVLNVLRGGTLIQHLPEVVGDDRYSSGGEVFNLNEATVEGGSALSRITQGDVSLDVRSHHHQALDRIGDGLRVTARSGDHVVQAVELEGADFGIGVQWHPEQGDDPRLFDALVDAARAHAASRAS